VSGAGGDLPDLSVLNVACKLGVDLFQATVYIFRSALSEHLYRPVRQVTDVTGQPIPPCDPLGRVPKSHTLDVSNEEDMSGDLFHSAQNLRTGRVENVTFDSIMGNRLV
jgi:hypothetical protein